MNDLLITTINGLVLWKDGESKMIARGNFYGLSWDYSRIYVSFNPQHRNVSEIEIFDLSFSRIGKLDTKGLLGVHQIFVWDDELHITNTSKDEIFVYNSGNTCQFNWTGRKEDSRHINSIWVNDDYIYVAEGMTSHLVDRPAIQVLSHQYEPVESIMLPAAMQIHNVYIEDDTLYSLGRFGLVERPMTLGETDYTITDLRPDKSNGFLRGLARSEDFFYIGESQINPRDKRPYGDSRVLILDNNRRVKDTIELRDTGQIQDVRIINALDKAHNGIIFNY